MVLQIAYNIFETFQSGGITDDDSTDRLSYRVTTLILIASSVLIATKQLVGEPISCWVPAHFTGNHEEYTNNYCWIRNTYYLPWDSNIPKEHEGEKRYMITYYQWIPLMLLIQALFFYMPRLFWTGLKSRVGVDVGMLMNEGKKLQNSKEFDDHKTILENMAIHMHRMLRRPHGKSKMTSSLKSMISRACCRCAGRSKGNYLVMVYMLSKVLYMANIIGQMFVLNYVLGFNFHRYGIEVIERLAHNEEWVETPFPRVTMCDMKIRRLGNVHRYAVQCVLPINLFTEKLYLFQWFWFVLLLAMSFSEFVQWIYRLVIWKKQRRDYIQKHLDMVTLNFNDDDTINPHDVDEFADSYLKQDGVFILRILAKNTTQSVTTLFVKSLWSHFEPWWQEKHKEPKKKLSDEVDDSTLPLTKPRF